MSFFSRKIEGLKEIFFFDNFIHLIFNALFFPSMSAMIYRKGEYKILIDKSKGDVNGVRNVVISPMYGSLLAQCQLESSINVMDLGANAGGFPLMLAIKGVKISHYIGVEMSPFTFSRLYYNVHTNLKKSSIQLIQKAIFPNVGEVELSLSDGSTGDSIFNTSLLNRKNDLIRIKTTTFDEVANLFHGEIIDICKIDIESSEYVVFENQQTCQLLHNVKNIIIEIHEATGKVRQTLIQQIKSRGFHLKMQNDDVYLFQSTRL